MLNEFEVISLRPSYDIDILFSQEEAYEAYKLLKDNGYKEFRAIPNQKINSKIMQKNTIIFLSFVEKQI